MKFLNSSVVLLSLASLFTDIATEAIYPILPVYLSSVLAASPTVIGLIEGLAESAASIFKFISGAISDRMGKSKPIVLSGYFLAGLSRPLMGLTSSWVIALVLRFTDRVGKGFRGPPRDAWLTSVSTPITAPFVFGFHRGMDHLGATLGPLLAALFLVTNPGAYSDLFLWTLVPGGLSLVCVALAREYPSPKTQLKPNSFWSGWREFSPELKRFFLVLFFFAFGNSSDAFLLLRLQQTGIEITWLPLLWTLFHIVKMGAAFLSGELNFRVGPLRLMIFGWCIYAIVYLGFCLLDNIAILILLFFFYGLYHGLTESSEKTIISRLAPKPILGTAFGIHGMGVGIALFPASLLFGVAWELIGFRTAFAFNSAIALMAATSLAMLSISYTPSNLTDNIITKN